MDMILHRKLRKKGAAVLFVEKDVEVPEELR